MTNRALINDAWSEGYSAGKRGDLRFSNPHAGKDPELAKAWDQGWADGSGT